MKTKIWLAAAILFLSVNLFAQNDGTSPQNGIIKGKVAFTDTVGKIKQQSDSISTFVEIISYTDWGKKNYKELGLPNKSIDGKFMVIKVNINTNKYQILAYKYLYIREDIEDNLKYCRMAPWKSTEPNTLAAKWITICNSNKLIAKTTIN